MIFSKPRKTKSVGKHFILSEEEKKKFNQSLNKIIGQLETIKRDVAEDNACDETLTQILAIRGGVSSVGQNLVGQGILDCLGQYSKEELALIMKNMFKLN